MRFSWRANLSGPLIVAHRGSSIRAPENTLAAFVRAMSEKADAIELDVRLTKDRELVACHDATVDRCSDGSGKVSDLTLRELKRFSAGGWFGKRFSDERFPSLREVFELCGDHIGINIELKFNPFDRKSPLIERCCELIGAFHLCDSLLITSFHHASVARLRELRPDIPAGLLLHPAHLVRKSVRLFPRLYDFDYLVLGGGSLRKSIVEDAHRHGVKVGEFTVNTRRRMERAFRFGLDAIITDDPLIAEKFR